MKPKNKIAMTLLLGLAVAAACYLAYARPVTKASDDDAAKLNQGIALLKQGRVDEAHAILTNLPAGSPVYGQAKAYGALCRYAKGDHKKFLSALESPEVKAAALPDDVREDLDYKQIDSLMYFRKFDEILPKAEQFARLHADSPRAQAMAEYQLASLYERGMKKLTEAAQLRAKGETAGADKHLHEGEDNLGRYLKLAAEGQRDGYETLTGRNLQAEAAETLAALGGEDQALKLEALGNLEETAFAMAQLHKKIDADADAKLRRMTNFLNDFPKSKHRQRLQYDIANVVLEEGWRLAWKSKPVQAAIYLDQARAMFSGVVVDKEAGVDETDVMESQKGIMRAFYAKQDYAGLSSWVAHCVTNVPAGGKDWLAFKLYDAAGLACQKKSAEAAAELEELLTIGFKGQPGYDGLLVSAAKWRIRVAKQTGDTATIQRMAQLVEKSDCYGSIKRTFTQNFKELVAEPNPLAK
jgi:hypothetical protein